MRNLNISDVSQEALLSSSSIGEDKVLFPQIGEEEFLHKSHNISERNLDTC